MRLIRSAWFVAAGLSGLISIALPSICNAETQGTSRTQLQRQIVDNLAKGKNVKELIAQFKSLPANNAVISSRREASASLQQQLSDFQQTLHGVASAGAVTPDTLSSIAEAYQVLQANHLLFKLHFSDIKQTLAEAGVAGTFEKRRQLAEDNYDQTFKGLTDILDSTFGDLLSSPDRAKLLAESSIQRAALDAIQKASAYLDASISRPSSPILRGSTLLPYRQATLAQRQPLLSPVIQPSYLNAIDQASPPQSEDSVASLDAPLTDEILLQAKSLGYDYIRIYEFVRNNIRTQWYAGAMKGAVGTLRQKSGNDIDQASLLIALFRASGLSARYIHGVVELTIEDVMNSLGVADITQTTTALTRAGVAYSVVIRGGRIAAVNVEHTWVSAYVPYTNYRGATVDASGATWLPLTPALKAYQLGLPTNVYSLAGFKADALIGDYLQQPQDADLLSVLRKQVGDYLQAQGKGASYAQQLGSTTITPKTLGLLPNTLPVNVVAVTGEEAVLADNYRQQIRFIVRQGTGDADKVILDYAVPMSVVQNERVTLSYIPATVDDQKTVDRFGGLDYTPAYLIKLRAQIKINGQQKAVAQDVLDAGMQHRFEVAATSPNGTERIAQTVVAGAYHAVGIYAQQVARVIPENDPADTEYLAAKLLDAVAYQYVDKWDSSEQEFANLMNVAVVHPWPTIVIVSNSHKVDTVLGRPMQLHWQGVTLDAALRIAEPVSRTSIMTQLKDWMQLTALQGSVLEHQLFENLYAVDSMSADKGLALARAGGIPVLSITSANSNALLPTLTLSAEVIDDITNWLRLGMTVEVPRDPITYQAWQGAVWRVQDSVTGAAGYFISGGLAGGSSAQSAWILQWLADALAGANSEEANTDPLSGAYISAVDGDSQQGEVGTPLPTPLSVLVRDSKGRPVLGAPVTFRATVGGGFLISEVGISSAVTIFTNALGIATLQYELGKVTKQSPVYVSAPGDEYRTLAGLNYVDSEVATYTGSLALAKPFQAIGLPGQPVQLSRTNDCCIGDGVPDYILDYVNVQVQDQYNNSVSNMDVNFNLMQLTPSSKGGSNGKLIGLCSGCEGLSVSDTTNENGTAVRVNLGSGYVQYEFVASAAAGTYTTKYHMGEPDWVTSTTIVVDALGHFVAATKAGGEFPDPIVGGFARFDHDARGYFPMSYGSISSEITNGGSVSQPAAISATEWQVSASAGSSPGFNRVTFTATDVAAPCIFDEDGYDERCKTTLTWVAGGFYGVTPTITGVDGPGTEGGIVPLNGDGLTQGPVSVTYSVLPPEYNSLGTSMDVFKNGGLDAYLVGSSRKGDGNALLVRDQPYVLDQAYTAQLVLNRGSPYEVKSEMFRLPLRMTIFKDYSRSLSVSQDIDTLNQRVCSLATSFSFTLTQPAVISLIATDAENPNAHTTLISSKSYPKGVNSEVFLPSDLTPGKYTFELTGVSEIDGHSETVTGKGMSEMVVRNALPIGHVTVKGVDLKDGHLFMSSTDLTVPGRGVPLDFRRSYSSSASYKPGELGTRWSHNFDSKVIINQCGEAIVIGGEGGGMRFVDDGNGGLKPLKGYHGSLIANHDDHTFDFFSKDGTRYHYRLFGGRAQWDLEFIQDTNGNVTKLAYDPTSSKVAKLQTVEDSAGRTLKFKYEARTFGGVLGDLTNVINLVEGPDGMKVSYEYDNDGNLIKASRADATRVEIYGYSPPAGPISGSQVLKSYTNPGNVTSTYTYNAGQVTVAPQGGGVSILLPNSYITAVEEGAQARTQFAFGSDWLSATVTDANGNVTSYALNQYGSPLRITDPVGTTTMTWSPDDIVMNSKTNGRGITTNYAYDLNANLLSETVGGATTTYTYATFPPTKPIKNRVKTKTDRNGNTTTYNYDGNGNLTSQADAAGVTLHSYAGNGDRAQTTDPRSNTTRFTYDTYGNLETLIDATGGITQTTHNSRGQLLSIKNANGYATTLTYDNLNRLLSKTDPLGGTRTYTYDNMGNKLSEKDEEGRNTVWTYDDQNRVTTIRNAAGGTKTYGYDPEGNKTSETDWDSNPTSYAYDGANRLTSRTEPLGKATSYSYDQVGNVTKETDALGRATSYSYDAMNRRTSKIDALQGATAYTYDAVGNKTSESDPLDHTTNFAYDGVNRLISATNALGATQYRYDPNGNRTAEIDALNRTTSFTYDALNRLTKRSDANGHDTNWVYDRMGNVTAEINARQYKTAHQYDALNRRTQTTEPGNAVTTYIYDKVGNRTGETWPNGNEVSNVYDTLNRLTSSNDSMGALAAYTYDANGNRTIETDARGNTTSKAYDALYRLTHAAMPEGRTVKYAYDLMGNKTTETDARNNTTQFTYDALNRLKTVTDPKQQTIAYDYDPVGNKLSETDKRGNATTYTYDALNRLTLVTDPLSNTTSFTYDAVGNKLSDTDKRGARTDYTYDKVNRLLNTTKASVTLQTQQYDEVGNIKFKTDANGNTSTYIYDGRNLLLTESRPLAAITNYQYDAIGNRTRMEDPEHRVTRWTYDQRRRNTSETNGASETTTYTYDGNGNRLTLQRPNNNTWTSVFDAANRLTSITDPLSGATTYTYDPNNNRLSQTDANGNTTAYAYDALNRQTAMTYVDGAQVTFSYDENNNRTSLTDAKGQSFSYAFDALNRNTQMNYPLPAASSGEDLQTISNGFDANGNLTQVRETYSGASGTRNTARSYDSFDRLTAVTDGFNKTLRYIYDANGNRTVLTDPDGNVTRYGFDALNRVSTVTNGGGTTTYAYDRSSLKTKVSYPNGTTAATTYDHAKRILTLVNRQGSAPVSSYSYTYDPNGNRTQQVENVTGADETTTYAYDGNDRLTTVNYPDKQTAYTFDANANRVTEVTTANSATTLSKTYTYNTRNQLINVADSVTPANDAVYSFDPNGNQTRKTQGATVTNYTYDVKDQLQVVSQNAANIGLFSYDYQGHRIVKDMGGSIVRYAYDGNSVLLETDNTGATLAKFDYGPDRLLSMTHASEGRAYYLFDALGSVANLTNTAGAIQARYQYDAYGNYRSTAGASFNRFGFTGHEKDNETNLYYFKARFYDPDTGRFLNQDAYLGDINTPPSLHRYLYAYANPTVYVDLYGYSSSSTDFDNAADSCESDACRGVMAVGKAFWIVGTLGFASVHDPVKDAYDEGKITRKQYAVGAAGGAVVAGVNVAAAVMSGGTATGVTSAVGTTLVNRMVSAAATGASIALANDSVAQATHVNAGIQDGYDAGRAATVTAAGATIGAAIPAVAAGVTSPAAKAFTGKVAGAISDTVAKATQAVKNVLTREGGKLDVAESLAPGVQKTVGAEASVAPKAEVQSRGLTDGATQVGTTLEVKMPKIFNDPTLTTEERAFLQRELSIKQQAINKAANRGELVWSPDTGNVRISNLQDEYRQAVAGRYQSMFGKELDLTGLNADHPVDLIIGGSATQRLKMLSESINKSVGASLFQAGRRAGLKAGDPIDSVVFIPK